MRINLTKDDLPTSITPTKAIPIENVGQLLCEFKGSVEFLQKSVEILITEIKGLRQDMLVGVQKADEGVLASKDILRALKELG